MSTKKQSFQKLKEDITRNATVREQYKSGDFDQLSDAEQEEEYQLAYLAEILVEIYLYNKCKDREHKIRVCEKCRKKHELRYY